MKRNERICHIVKSLDAKVVMINVMIVAVHLTTIMTKAKAKAKAIRQSIKL